MSKKFLDERYEGFYFQGADQLHVVCEHGYIPEGFDSERMLQVIKTRFEKLNIKDFILELGPGDSVKHKGMVPLVIKAKHKSREVLEKIVSETHKVIQFKARKVNLNHFLAVQESIMSNNCDRYSEQFGLFSKTAHETTPKEEPSVFDFLENYGLLEFSYPVGGSLVHILRGHAMVDKMTLGKGLLDRFRSEDDESSYFIPLKGSGCYLRDMVLAEKNEGLSEEEVSASLGDNYFIYDIISDSRVDLYATLSELLFMLGLQPLAQPLDNISELEDDLLQSLRGYLTPEASQEAALLEVGGFLRVPDSLMKKTLQ